MIDDEKIPNLFTRIMEGTRGSNTITADIITYKNGNSISLNQIKEEYIKYQKLDEDIDNYVEDNRLDIKEDREKIIDHFKDIVDKDLFNSWYGFLKDFTVYMITKIDKMNENYNIKEHKTKEENKKFNSSFEENRTVEIEDEEER